METNGSSTQTTLKLGFDNYSIRALGWKAHQLLDYAASLKLDSILLSDLDVFENHSEAYLGEIKSKADDLGLRMHVGTLSICPASALWSDRFGSPTEHLERTIRIAKQLGSPVARCVLGIVDDRRSPGGIEARIDETIEALQSVRQYALDSDVKIAVENHAGDLQAPELVNLIERAGSDFVGATLDSGNATWAMEHPLQNLEILGPYALSTGIRDSAVWETEDGAILQWTAIGEGQVDFSAYFKRFSEICPDTIIQLETISGHPIPIPFKTDEFWNAYPDSRARDFTGFLNLVHSGKARPPFQSSSSAAALKEEQEFQKSELERSIRYCRDVLGLGVRHR